MVAEASADSESPAAVIEALKAADTSDLEAVVDGLMGMSEDDALGAAVDWEDQVLDLGLSSGEQEEAEDIGAKMLRILSGQMNGDEATAYVAVMVLIVSTLMGVGMATFPSYKDKDDWFGQSYDYNILWNTMSSLGNRERNPDNWYWFTIAMIVQAVMYIPLILNLYNKMKVIDDKGIGTGFGALAATISFFIGCIGMVLLGLMDESMGTPHDLSAIVCFGGFIAGIAIYGVMFLVDGPELGGTGTYESVRGSLNVLYGICIATIIGLGVSQLIRVVMDLPRDSKEAPASLVNWPLWEWICWFTLQIYIPWMVVTLNQVET
jgi:hypothetical protein